LAKRHSDYKFAVFIIDVDDSKIFNDSLGHAVGDSLLIKLAKRFGARHYAAHGHHLAPQFITTL